LYIKALRTRIFWSFQKFNTLLSSLFLSYTKQYVKSTLFLTHFSLPILSPTYFSLHNFSSKPNTHGQRLKKTEHNRIANFKSSNFLYLILSKQFLKLIGDFSKSMNFKSISKKYVAVPNVPRDPLTSQNLMLTSALEALFKQ